MRCDCSSSITAVLRRAAAQDVLRFWRSERGSSWRSRRFLVAAAKAGCCRETRGPAKASAMLLLSSSRADWRLPAVAAPDYAFRKPLVVPWHNKFCLYPSRYRCSQHGAQTSGSVEDWRKQVQVVARRKIRPLLHGDWLRRHIIHQGEASSAAQQKGVTDAAASILHQDPR